MSTPTPKPKPPAPPSWWSPKAGIWLAVAFVGIAGYPYAKSAVNLLQEGKPVDVASVKKQTMKMEMKREKEEHGRGEDPKKLREIKSLALAPDGSVWGGGKAGIFRQQEGKWVAVAGYPDVEVKSINVSTNGSVLVTGKHGVYLLRNQVWTQVYEDDAHTALMGNDGTLYVGTKEGMKRKQGQGDWEAYSEGLPLPAEIAQQ